MGCYIHMQIEYRSKNSEGRFEPFGKTFNPGQAYVLFAVMAGVRDDEDKPTKMFEPRGLPENLSYSFQDDYYLHIVDLQPEEETPGGCVSRAKAEDWTSRGLSHYAFDGNYVSDPDAHSESWLTTQELLSCFNTVEKDIPDLAMRAPKWTASIAAMQALEKCGFDARVVFYFDN